MWHLQLRSPAAAWNTELITYLAECSPSQQFMVILWAPERHTWTKGKRGFCSFRVSQPTSSFPAASPYPLKLLSFRSWASRNKGQGTVELDSFCCFSIGIKDFLKVSDWIKTTVIPQFIFPQHPMTQVRISENRWYMLRNGQTRPL